MGKLIKWSLLTSAVKIVVFFARPLTWRQYLSLISRTQLTVDQSVMPMYAWRWPHYWEQTLPYVPLVQEATHHGSDQETLR